jgi:ATP-dependent Clp protease ATP-binding subunit ClpB
MLARKHMLRTATRAAIYRPITPYVCARSAIPALTRSYASGPGGPPYGGGPGGPGGSPGGGFGGMRFPGMAQKPPEKGEHLKQFSVDLTELARSGKLDPTIGRDAEIRRTIEILSRRAKSNPVL